jgi:hemophore-related protein
MRLANHHTTRSVLAAIGVGAAACALTFTVAPSASADDLPPNCTAADLAQVATGVSAATSVYLFSHPDVNAFLTGLEGSPRDTVRAQVADYMAANPQVQAEMGAIRQPLVDMHSRCGGSSDDQS